MAPNDVSNEISIIGMGMRLPGGVTTKEAFWDLLCQPEPAIRQVPEGRGWTAAEYVCKEGKVGCTVTDRAGWVDDVDRFDPAAFKISPKEAAEMDPQQRLTLECSYEALLDAYVNPTSLAGTNTGVFVGAGIAEYMAMAFSDPNNMTMHTMSGNSLAVIANRVSNIWDLRGPSLTTDTACSSAMTALHLGVQALKTGDCDLAIVVGVNSLLGPSPFIGFTQAQMLSPTGTSRPFDQNANGFVRGEGCGVLILKRTADIVASDPGRIYAYVRGSGINEDGKTKSLTMPSEEAQHDLMADVIRKSGTTPEDIVFVEAHGTGTKVGDPIEARSIVRSTLGSRSQVAVGSAKGHVGHLETAAGIVGVLKATLILYNNQIPPTAGFTKLSDNIENTIRIPSSVEELPMPASGNAPCTSINSYGFGGSNGYAILAQAPKAESKAASPQPTVLALSSHFADGVEKSEKTWKALTVAPEGVAIGAAVSTACRPPQRYRKVLIAEPGAPLTKAQSVAGERVGASPAVLFAFGGQGSQYAEMGRALYDQFPVFRRTIDELCAEYKQLSTIDLQKEHGFCQRDIPEESLGSVMVSVPSTVFVQCALVELLTDAGISAAAAVGHSTGEIVAAYTAGCIDKTALVKVTHARAAAQCAMKEGAMAAWAAPAKDAEAVVAQLGLQDKVCVSCINTATGVTLSGEKEAVEKLIAHGKSLNPPVRCTVLPITRAYHSPHVDEVRAKFLQLAEGVVSQAPHKCPLLSATFGKQQGTATDPEYFFENMRRPVLFEKACVAVASLAAAGVEPKVVLEVSPHAVLMPYLSENLNEMKYVPCLNKKRPGATHMLMALGTLFTSGVEVDWAKALSPAIEQASGDLKIPSLVWQHKDPIRSVTWVLPYSHNQKGAPALLQVPKPQEGRQRALSDAAAREAAEGSNQLLITPEKQEYLRDHIVDGECVLPGAFYVCAAVQRGHMLQNAGFHRYLSLHDKFMKEDAKGGVPLNIVADGPRMALCSNGDPETNEHFSCFLPRFPPAQPELMFKGKVAELKAKFAEQARVGGGDVNLNSAYTSLETFSGLKFGPAFRRMTSLRVARDGCEALASITPPDVDSRRDDAARVMHPSVLDGAFQALAFLHGLDSDMFVPNAIKQMFIVHPCSGAPEVLAHAALKHVSRDVVIGDIDIYDANSGEVAVIIRGLTLRRAPSGKSKAPRLYATKLQTLGLQTAPTPCPEAFDDLLTLVRNTLSTGRVVRILGLPGSNGVMEKLAKELSLSGPKESAVCPLRNSQLVLVTMDETMTGQAVHRVVDAGAVVAGSWDVLVCGNDADLHGDTRTPVAQRFLNDGGILCGATCWVRFEKKEAVDTSALKVEVLGSDAFGSGVARADAEYVIDCRADVGAASALMKDIMAAKQSPTVVCLVPYDEAQTGGVLAVKDRALALRGWCRCARNETGLDVLSLQVPFPVTAETAGKVLELLGRKAPDQELKLSADGKWEVPRILPVIGGASVATETEDVRLQVGRPGQLSSLHWHPLQADFEDVREDEVQVQVSAVSMHFKDVMLAMGMLGDFKPIIGMECAGTVTRVGSGVKNFKIGDQVMCLAMSTSVGEERSALFGTKCISKERQTVLMPKRDDLSFVEAAGFLGVMATAWHALVKVAQLSKEDTVLIHSTLGGVGQAALQIALNTGCRIIGSAGNAEKRSALLDMGCHMVMDSRNPSEFVSKVMEFTEGRGVDVVLNSLAGDGQVCA